MNVNTHHKMENSLLVNFDKICIVQGLWPNYEAFIKNPILIKISTKFQCNISTCTCTCMCIRKCNNREFSPKVKIFEEIKIVTKNKVK